MQGILEAQTQAPSVRGNLVATALGVSQVKLSWTASTDGVGVKKYEVQRRDPGSTSFVHVGTTTRNELHRQWIGSRRQLQLSGPGKGCEGAREKVFGCGERDNSFTNNRPSHTTVTRDETS